MKTLFSALALMAGVGSLSAAPDPVVSKAASGTTSATVYFEPGSVGALVAADVTSDKAASVLSWRVGAQPVSLLVAAASNVTNLLTTVGTVASNAALVSVTSAGTVTAHTAFTSSLLTNALVTLANSLGTNLTATSVAREVTTTAFAITATSSTNVVNITSNLNAIAVGTNFLFEGLPGQVITNQVKSWITNAGDFVITLSNNWTFIPQRAYVLTTNVYTVTFAASASDTSAVLVNSNGIVPLDRLVFLPSTGGAALRDVSAVEEYRYQSQNLSAVTGLALAAGDRLFVLGTAVTTPVGAASLRLFGNPVRLLPPNLPGVLSIDGTSACAINTAIVRYE